MAALADNGAVNGAVNGTVQRVVNTINGMPGMRSLAEKGGAVIFVVLALISLAVLIAFLVIRLKSADSKGALIVKDPLRLYNTTAQVRVDQSGVPPTVLGQEFSASFWLYLVDFVPTQSAPQLVFLRGSESSTAGANPIVAFDGSTNRMYIGVRTSRATRATDTGARFYEDPSTGYLTATIEYFPLQRWVHVVAQVRDDTLSVYLNNSLYTVANVADMIDAATPTRPVFSACTGHVVVGANGVPDVREVRAYIAQFNFYNYALTTKDIAALYKAGPSNASLLAKLGLAGYGLRSPVYKIEDSA